MRSLSRIVVRTDPTGMLGPVVGLSAETDMQRLPHPHHRAVRWRPASRWAWAAIMILALLAPAGCGADEPDPTGTVPAPRDLQPPVYWLAREDLPADSRGLNFRAVDPVQLQILIEGADATPPTPPAYRLKAGETVRIWWRTRHGPVPGDASETRGERLRIEFGFVGQPAIWTTSDAPPGEHPVDVQTHDVLPPPSPEPLALDTHLELVVMAGASLPEGQLRIRPRPAGSRVAPEGAEKAVLRLLVKAEPVGRNTR